MLDECGCNEMRRCNWHPEGIAVTVLLFPWWPIAPYNTSQFWFAGEHVQKMKLTPVKILTAPWIFRKPAIVQSLKHVCRIIRVARLICWKIMAYAKVVFSFWNVHLAFLGHSHCMEPSDFLRWDVSDIFSKMGSGRMSLAYFQINLWWKLLNLRSTWTSLSNIGIGESSIVDIQSDSMWTPLVVISKCKKLTYKPLTRHHFIIKR